MSIELICLFVLIGLIVYIQLTNTFEKSRLIKENNKAIKDLMDRIMSVDYSALHKGNLELENLNSSLKIELEKIKKQGKPTVMNTEEVIESLKTTGRISEI